MSDKSLVSVFSQAPAATQNTFASENFNTVLYTGNGGTQRIGGYINRGAVFNGSSSYISIADNTALRLAGGDYTISFWFNTNAVGSTQRIINKDDATDYSAGYSILLESDGSFTWVHNDGSNNQNWNVGGSISANTWYHVCAVYSDSNNLRTFYLNGSSIGTIATNTNLAGGTDVLLFGSYGASSPQGQYFNGKIDQVRIFDKALSSSEVTTLYNETHASTTKSTTDIFNDGSGVALYQLDGNANDTGGASGRFDGSAAHFNGTSSELHLVSPSSTWATDTYTFAAWFKMFEDNIVLVSNYNGGGYAAGDFYIYVDDANSRVIIQAHDGAGHQYTATGASLTQGSWHHIAVTYDGTSGGYTVYLDNSALSGSITDGSSSGGTSINNSDPLQMGNHVGNTSSWSEMIVDEVYFYQDELTSTEVGYLYNNTTASIPTDYIAYYKFNGDARDETTSPSYDGVAENIKYAYNGTASNIVYQEATKFTPDLVWIKPRSIADNHNLFDSLRGPTKQLISNLTAAENTQVNTLTSFDDTGFTIGTDNNVNTNNATHVAWCFNAGTDAAASNTDGTITSTVKANTEAGFSIVSYTGNQTGSTIGHGLFQAPEMIIAKSRSVAQNWAVYHKDAGNQYWLQLNSTNAKLDEAIWNDTTPTDSVFSINNNVVINASGSTNIAYCFHSVDGYQKIGSYTGTQASNVVETGFAPAFLLIKNSSSADGNWMLIDNKRSTTNPRTKKLTANTNAIENDSSYAGGDSAHNVNFLSDGFELLDTSTGKNTNFNGHTYIYLAIAADPDETTPTVENSFDVVTYDGAGAAQKISTDFKPDLIWFKERNGTANHQIIDSVRGDQAIFPNLTNAQSSQTVVDIEEDGFSFTGDDASINDDGNTMVAWVWKAGDHDDNLPEINTNGSIDSTVSVNDAAGFSIVKYTGNGTAGATIGHGLSSTPQMIIIKNLDSTANWAVYTEITGTNATLLLNSTSASTSVSNKYAGTNSTVFGVNSASDVNTSGNEYIAYCWYSVSGHSKIGSYDGTGAAGNAQNVGFKPRFLMIKRSNGAASQWTIFDTQRDGKALYADLSNAEASEVRVNLTSTGFDFDGSAFNESNTDWVYMAFK